PPDRLTPLSANKTPVLLLRTQDLQHIRRNGLADTPRRRWSSCHQANLCILVAFDLPLSCLPHSLASSAQAGSQQRTSSSSTPSGGDDLATVPADKWERVRYGSITPQLSCADPLALPRRDYKARQTRMAPTAKMAI